MMNSPEHIVVDEFGLLVAAAKAALGLPELNYQYGYPDELNETLVQWAGTIEHSEKKFPLVWLVQPFTIRRGNDAEGFYGETSLRWFVINETDKLWKAEQRMTNNFKQVIYPIKREMIKQFIESEVFASVNSGYAYTYEETDRYYWGEEQQRIIDDCFDCLEINDFKTLIYNNINS